MSQARPYIVPMLPLRQRGFGSLIVMDPPAVLQSAAQQPAAQQNEPLARLGIQSQGLGLVHANPATSGVMVCMTIIESFKQCLWVLH